jgi:hypothetical protein
VAALKSVQAWLGLGLLVAAWSGGNPLAGADEKVHVTIAVILATDRDEVVDPRLSCIAREVRKREPGLTGFHLDSANCHSVAVGDRAQFKLVEGQIAEVEVQAGADQNDRITLKIKPPLGGEIAYTSVCNKFFPIVTRYQTATKDRLIIAIRVQCRKSAKGCK